MTKMERQYEINKAFRILDRIDELAKRFGKEVNMILKDEISERGNTIISANLEDAIKRVESCISITDEAAEELLDVNDMWDDEEEYGEILV